MSSECAKIVFFVLSPKKELPQSIVGKIAQRYGELDFVGSWHGFDHTNYYEPEMGAPLYRCLVSTKNLIRWCDAVELKAIASTWEDEARADGKRTINIDPGCVDYYKFVLLSGKHGGHKIMMRDNVWADLLLWFDKDWKPFPWTFPDFKNKVYDQELSKVRSIFKKQVKEITEVSSK